MREGDNIAAVGALMPEYMGFIFVPSSPRYVGTSLPPEAAALPSSITRVGVFRDAPLRQIQEAVERNGLSAVQLHGDEDDSYLRDVRARLPSTLLIKAIKVAARSDIEAIAQRTESPDLYLLDSGAGGTGTPFNWSWLESYKGSLPFLLAGGIDLTNIEDAVRAARINPALVGLDINSRFEVSPGIKDVTKIAEALTRLKV
jgi:phosphoribosylanthranilate isomerase